MIHCAKKHWLIVLLLLVVLTAVGGASQLWGSTLRTDPNTVLAPCTPGDARYASLSFKGGSVDSWVEQYHEQVNSVVEEYSKPAQNIACTEDKLLPVTTGDALYDLAKKLPPWSTAEKLEDLRKNDVGFVLLEFLRVYECALLDRGNFTRLYVQNEYENSGTDRELRVYDQELKTRAERETIEQELRIARPTLEKALQIVTGDMRLATLDAELQCLQRASLDIRNSLSLAADASSCLPRIWNSKDVLRTLAD